MLPTTSPTTAPTLSEIVDFFRGLQARICTAIETADGGATFQHDVWQRAAGGDGQTNLIQNGNVLERGGVAFSHVHGPMPEKITNRLGLPAGVDFDATGVSIVLHPRSPRVPIIHMNTRFFQTSDGTHWFGGGIDLTPIYIIPEDAQYFHSRLKAVCDAFDPSYYADYKAQADSYFYLKHRKETRGVGGIFYDHLKAATPDEMRKHFAFTQAVGEAFADIYINIINRHRDEPFTERELAFQALRRSRYVEFNLVWDAGTKFGLETDGRTESILMSMPPTAAWTYDYQPEPDSPESFTLESLRPIDWLNNK